MAAAETNERGRIANKEMGAKLARKFRQFDSAVDELLRPIMADPASPPNERKTATAKSHPTSQASDAGVHLLAESDVDSGEEKLRQALREATLAGTIPTCVVDTGASSSLGAKTKTEQEHISECGAFRFNNNPYRKTGRKSSKIFQNATGGIAAADEIVHFNLPLRQEATEAHTVDTATYNLLSMNMLRKAGYAAEFIEDQVQFFDVRGEKITRSRQAVLEGWWCPRDGLWRIPLTSCDDVRNVNK